MTANSVVVAGTSCSELSADGFSAAALPSDRTPHVEELPHDRDREATHQSPVIAPLTDEEFALPTEDGLPDARRTELVDRPRSCSTRQKGDSPGYRVNGDARCADDPAPFLDHSIDNVSDSFRGSNFTVRSRAAERAVLNRYARSPRCRARSPDLPPADYSEGQPGEGRAAIDRPAHVGRRLRQHATLRSPGP